MFFNAIGIIEKKTLNVCNNFNNYRNNKNNNINNRNSNKNNSIVNNKRNSNNNSTMGLIQTAIHFEPMIDIPASNYSCIYSTMSFVMDPPFFIVLGI